ncbi:MAG: zinc ribbon domain-containing protein [Erysipelotrichaceae bacterium]|nr:zinc ribbon domain-containing protein [Erysipelotrichaceae bacterium]
MSIFDKIGEGVKNLTEKATDVVEVTKISSKINAEKNVIGNLKCRLGDIVWENFVKGETLQADMLEICHKIKESELIILKFEEEIERIKPSEAKPTKCKKCGAELKVNAKFCPDCGEKLVEEKVVEAKVEVGKHCPSCNEVLDKEVTFCPECGYQFKD